jgi:hypothetical protein
MRNSQMEDVDILNLFDFKDPDQVVGTRMPTTVPTQSLYLMNAPFVKQEAKRLATSLLDQNGLDDGARVSRDFRPLNRPATERDILQAKQFLSDFEGDLRKNAALQRANRRRRRAMTGWKLGRATAMQFSLRVNFFIGDSCYGPSNRPGSR